MRLGVAIADIAAGMFAFQGLLLALIARGRTGRGQLVDVSLLDSVAALLTYQASAYFATGESPARTGNRHMTIAPYDTFETADGVLVLAVGNDAQWQQLCAALGATSSALTHGSRPTRAACALRRAAPGARGRACAAGARSRWSTRCATAGVPCGAVRSIAEALARSADRSRAQMVETVDASAIGALKVLGMPVKLSDTPGAVSTAPPRARRAHARGAQEISDLS